MPTLTFKPVAGANSPADGYAGRIGTNETFATMRNSAGTVASVTWPDLELRVRSGSTTNRFSSIARSIINFNTSSIPDNAIITSVKLKVWCTSIGSGLGQPSFDIVPATPASTANVTASDYSQLGTDLHGTAPFSSFNFNQYTEISIDETFFSYLNRSGVTSYGLRLGWDRENNFTGVWAADQSSLIFVRSADGANPAQHPELIVEYELPTKVVQSDGSVIDTAVHHIASDGTVTMVRVKIVESS